MGRRFSERRNGSCAVIPERTRVVRLKKKAEKARRGPGGLVKGRPGGNQSSRALLHILVSQQQHPGRKQRSATTGSGGQHPELTTPCVTKQRPSGQALGATRLSDPVMLC